MDERASSRRRLLRGAGIAGIAALAGCLGGDDDGDETDDGTVDETDDGATSSGETTDDEAEDEAEVDDDEDDGDEDESDEEFVDATGEDVVTVETREGEDDEPNFVFDPAFVTVDVGTTIEWVNTDGAFHTVTSTDDVEVRIGGGDEFDATISSEGDTFEWDADETGQQAYYCSPHAGFMYGAIEIE